MSNVVPKPSATQDHSNDEVIYRASTAGIENILPTLLSLLSNGLQPSVPLKHHQLRLKWIYGASWPLYFDAPLDFLSTSILVQHCIIITASLNSGENSDLESGRGLDNETAGDGGGGL
jgi:hypothetical protein